MDTAVLMLDPPKDVSTKAWHSRSRNYQVAMLKYKSGKKYKISIYGFA